MDIIRGHPMNKALVLATGLSRELGSLDREYERRDKIENRDEYTSTQHLIDIEGDGEALGGGYAYAFHRKEDKFSQERRSGTGNRK
jgi:hypothetical protein